MKRKIIVLLFAILLPNILKAECDSVKLMEYESKANYVTSNTSYVSKNGTFKVTLYNVVDGIRISYNNQNYTANSNKEVEIDNISEGTDMEILIYPETDSCMEVVGSININIPYYNKFYHDSRCGEYIDKVSVCSQKFLTIPMTEKLFKDIINNQDTPLIEVEQQEQVTLMSKILDFILKWGIKVLVVIIASVGSYMFFNKKFRKIKHGI